MIWGFTSVPGANLTAAGCWEKVALSCHILIINAVIYGYPAVNGLNQKNNGFRWGYKLQTPISGGFGFPSNKCFFGVSTLWKNIAGCLTVGWLPGHLSNEKAPWLFRVCRRLYFPGI